MERKSNGTGLHTSAHVFSPSTTPIATPGTFHLFKFSSANFLKSVLNGFALSSFSGVCCAAVSGRTIAIEVIDTRCENSSISRNRRDSYEEAFWETLNAMDGRCIGCEHLVVVALLGLRIVSGLQVCPAYQQKYLAEKYLSITRRYSMGFPGT